MLLVNLILQLRLALLQQFELLPQGDDGVFGTLFCLSLTSAKQLHEPFHVCEFTCELVQFKV